MPAQNRCSCSSLFSSLLAGPASTRQRVSMSPLCTLHLRSLRRSRGAPGCHMCCYYNSFCCCHSPFHFGIYRYDKTIQKHPRPLVHRFSFFPYPPLAAKDLIDFYCSWSLIGQTIFSFLIPLGLLWFLLFVLTRILPPGGVLMMFAILTGVIASTMYTWLLAFVTFSLTPACRSACPYC